MIRKDRVEDGNLTHAVNMGVASPAKSRRSSADRKIAIRYAWREIGIAGHRDPYFFLYNCLRLDLFFIQSAREKE